MHHHESGERYGKVISESFLAEPCSEMWQIALFPFFVGDIADEVTRIEHLVDEFVAFFAIFAKEGV